MIRYFAEGSVRQSGGKLRLSIRLAGPEVCAVKKRSMGDASMSLAGS